MPTAKKLAPGRLKNSERSIVVDGCDGVVTGPT
jgi:hypothetical protein